MANRWLSVMVARCLRQLRLVKRSPPLKATDIFGGNLASVSDIGEGYVFVNAVMFFSTSPAVKSTSCSDHD